VLRGRAAGFGFPWILSSESGLFNGLRAIFGVRFFDARFSSLEAALADPAGRFASLLMTRAQSSGPVFSGSTLDIVSFDSPGRSPIPKPFHHEAAARFRQEFVGKSDSQGWGYAARHRNAFGAVKAIAAASLALHGDGRHRVSLDVVVAAMRQTGADMQSKYKETSLGGLAMDSWSAEDKSRSDCRKRLARRSRRKPSSTMARFAYRSSYLLSQLSRHTLAGAAALG
jgi:hypothetical protein